MSYLNQVVDAIRSILQLIPEDQRQEAVRQLNRELGLQQLDVPRMYRDHDIAERYDVCVQTVRKWITSGRLRGCQIDRYWYSRADWLDEFERKELNTKIPYDKWSSVGKKFELVEDELSSP